MDSGLPLIGKIWTRWILGCLSSARSSILANGSPTNELDITRGLRQGDHLSPFLVLIAMEGVHITMKSAKIDRVISWHKPIRW